MKTKKTVGVFFGSKSAEHEISVITGQLVINTLKKLGYKVIPVYITKQGKWIIDEKLSNISFFTQNPDFIESPEKYIKSNFSVDFTNTGKIIVRTYGKLFPTTYEIDIAFPALHGTFGEDGTIQGIFEMLNVPYVGCNVTSSAIAMDKSLTKELISFHGIPTPDFITFNKDEWKLDKDKLIQKIQSKLKLPVFVKPPHTGSSIGISKVKSWNDLENAIEVGFFYDNKILVEQGIENTLDLTCCVIGVDKPIASLIQQSEFKSDLFDFNEKYINDGGAQTGNSTKNLIIPANIDSETTEKIRNTAINVYKIIGTTGVARVDFVMDSQTNEFFVTEVNPLPGTLYHHLWKASGIEVEELVENLIEYALQTHMEKNEIEYTFKSDVLNNLKGQKLKTVTE